MITCNVLNISAHGKANNMKKKFDSKLNAFCVIAKFITGFEINACLLARDKLKSPQASYFLASLDRRTCH